MSDPIVLDIRRAPSQHSDSLRDATLLGLKEPTNRKSIPTVLLYDEVGLRMYDRITTDAVEYYPFACEEQILRDNSTAIVQALRPDPQLSRRAVVVELGAG
jgi:L-histidine Nalpha-methyltransferase / hercynylcysteine S-oxide synthase